MSDLIVLLVVVLAIAGTAHIYVRTFWRACLVSVAGSGVAYLVLVLVFVPDEATNEMFGAGMVEVGLFAFVLSMLVGIPVAIYRRTRNPLEHEQQREQANRLGCPQCGEMAKRGGFKAWQIIVAICSFPIGMLALLADRKPAQCTKCHHTWQA